MPWSWLSANPGVYVLDMQDGADSVAVKSCAGTLPGFSQPWALVQAHAEQGNITGISDSFFGPGPQGCLVWRNTADSDTFLVAAFDKLGMEETTSGLI